MTIGPVRAFTDGAIEAHNSSEAPVPEQAVRNRETARAVQTINDQEVFGPTSELRFAIDRQTGRSLIRIVDRATNEVLNQLPPEEVLRLAASLAGSGKGGRFA